MDNKSQQQASQVICLHTQRLVLRPIQLSDAAEVANLADNSKVARHLRDRFPSPYTLTDANAFIAMVNEPGTSEIAFAVRLVRATAAVLVGPHSGSKGEVSEGQSQSEGDGELIGVVSLTRGSDVYRHSAELGYWLGEPFWGRGYGAEAARVVVRWGFESDWRLARVWATTYSNNEPSQRLLRQIGFTMEGVRRCAVFKAGIVMDDVMFGMVRSDVEAGKS